MDRNSVIGLVLIGLIMIVWMQFMAPERKPMQDMTTTDVTAVDETPESSREAAVAPVQELDFLTRGDAEVNGAERASQCRAGAV